MSLSKYFDLVQKTCLYWAKCVHLGSKNIFMHRYYLFIIPEGFYRREFIRSDVRQGFIYMPKFVSTLVLVACCFVTNVDKTCQTLLYGARLGSFPKPDFRVNFTLFSQQGIHSFKEIRHGLNVDPFYVRVYARARNADGNLLCFNGVGASQASPKISGYGGIIYAYNSMYVRIWAPTQYQNYSNGGIIFLKDGWGGRYVQYSSEAEVVVEVWKAGPDPSLQIDVVIDTSKSSFREIDHKLGQIPERISVTVTPEGPQSHKTNPNKGFWFNAIGSSQNPSPTAHFGGVIFAYNAKRIRLWAADGNLNSTGCIFVGHGWGSEKYSQHSKKCLVRIKLWTNLLPVPEFQSEWATLTANASSQYIQHNLAILPSLVIVQLKITSGINFDFIFEAQGAIQSGNNNFNGYGGVTFAYDENTVHVWVPSRNDSSNKGFAVLIKKGWGDGKNLQQSTRVDYRVVVHTSPCDGSFETTYERDKCITTKYLSYQWTNATPWTECSSICNNGTKKRTIQGCKVTTRKAVLSCNFENDFCGWTSPPLSSIVAMQWVRTNQATPEGNTGPMWGYPKGSYYAYTNSTKVLLGRKAILTSPNIDNGKNCRLRFFWNMFGRDIGVLKVHVKPNGYNFQESKWSMEKPQGALVWRQAVVNLEGFIVQKLRFIHELPKYYVCPSYRDCACPQKVCPRGNVAIGNIHLECEVEEEAEVFDAEVCNKRVVTSAACEHYAVDYETKGPAYSEERTPNNGKRFVKALGKTNDTIASYRIHIHFRAQYVLWAHVFSINFSTNSFSFRINEGEWHHWHTLKLSTHELWQNYRYETFLLSPGVHTVTLQQDDYGFRFDKMILAPATVTQWSDLGMQSRHIPDSNLYAWPVPQSVPPPREGRLNGMDAWCSADHNPGHVFFQIRLPDLAMVSGVAVQGGQNIVKKSNNYWVISFQMKVSLDGYKYTWYRDRAFGKKLFRANKNGGSIVMHTLHFPVPARGIRIYPESWQNWICMRSELYGFYILPEMCATAPRHPVTSSPCVGNRDCGKNADCSKASDSKVPMSVLNVTESMGGAETCHCHIGFHGPSCQHYGCKPNPCWNNGKCFQHSNSFTCQCLAGYHGKACQHPCPSGRYGNNCSGICLCTRYGSCDMVTGECSCYKGYYGLHCEKECPDGYYGYNCTQRCQCQRGASCDRASGACNCTEGWTGTFCDRPCPKMVWGYGCDSNCSCTKSALFCDRFTGKCVCPPGIMGSRCEQECRDGRYGLGCVRSCLCHNKAVCSKADGTCSCSVPGMTGVLCDMPCPGGTYGLNCAQRCSCQHGASCDRFNGSCECPSGWMGRFCDELCPQGYWGTNCSLPCHCVNGAHCDPQTGRCHCAAASGCKCSSGWTGSDCRELCPEGWWGQNCERTCSCVNQGICNKINGSCVCQPGYTGARCENPCKIGYYGLGCANSCPCSPDRFLSCHRATGVCQCRVGWQGRSCDIPCQKGSWGANCTSRCKCVNGSCDPATGNCSCFAGVQDRFCDKPCKGGLFGPKCKYKCSCKRGTCDPITGRCLCQTGWNGVYCDSSCANGTYSPPLCDKPCQCRGMSSCSSKNGSCQCLPGWTGLQCDSKCHSGHYGFMCQAECPACHHGNGTCDAETGKCHCLPGYTGDTCADVCPPGYYGNQCKFQCQCSNGGVCNHIDGSCSCAPGWTGRHCTEECPDGRYGPDCTARCFCSSSTCNKINGSCTCVAGYHGNTCSSPCPTGTFGLGCQLKCDCKNRGSCNSASGVCYCPPGWSGTHCSTKCLQGFYGASCRSRCSCPITAACDPTTGTCLCPPGKEGPLCLEACKEGFFGINCSQPCTCKHPHSCHPVNGSCTCDRGWTGANCTVPCRAGSYGLGCGSKCACDPDVTEKRRPCDHVTGQCNCKPRYYGPSCRDECREGYYGKNCSQLCRCQNGGVCNFVDGTCTCLPGYLGNHCELRCTEGSYGVNCSTQCKCRKDNTKMCDPVDGLCVCLDGYMGVQCEDPCPEGTFGLACKHKCTCKNEAHCDHVTGSCKCTAGHSGKNCDKPCQVGWYGAGCASKCLCENWVQCNRFNGSCICAPGYQGQRCERACLEGRYGLNCAQLCDCNPKNTDSCDRVTGKCLCRPGTRGKRCDEPCRDGFYGKECKMVCPECSEHVIGECQKQHGHCTCSVGYHGYLCQDSCPVGFYGVDCLNTCTCKKGSICHHVSGDCMDIGFARLALVIDLQVKWFKDRDQQRNFRIGLEKLMFKYFTVFIEKRQTRLSASSRKRTFAFQQLLRADNNNTSADIPTKSPSGTSVTPPVPVSGKHDFTVRIVTFNEARLSAVDTGTIVTWVLVDNDTVLNASIIQKVIDTIPPEEISEAIAAKYFVGALYSKPEKGRVPLWVIGIVTGSGFMLVMGFFAVFKLMRKKRRSKRGSPHYRPSKKDQAEFEMQPCIGRSPTYPLAFDNPYYDVVAVMGLDDDIEEDYYNPLYDDVSVYSDSNYNSSTDDSIHKDNLINSMVLS